MMPSWSSKEGQQALQEKWVQNTSLMYRVSIQNLTNLGPFNIEVFSSEELLVNITHHELVPKHMVLSDQEKAELLKR